MGPIGSSYDNALAEAVFDTLKRELDVDHRRWASEAEARRDVFRWIALLQPPPPPLRNSATAAPPTTNNPHTHYPAPDRGINRVSTSRGNLSFG